MVINNHIVLSKKDTNCIKGISIVLIVLHNLLRLKSGFVENEFYYDQNNVVYALSADWEQMYSMLLTFFGWYGVPCFIFITGYGLTTKYAVNDYTIRSFSVLEHMKKLEILSLPLILFYIVRYFQNVSGSWSIIRILSFTTFSANIFYFKNLSIEWYIGLTAQLYVLWYLCYAKKFIRIPVLFFLCVLLLIGSITVFPDNYLLFFRHNFIGWIIPFLGGCYFHRIRVPQIVLKHNLITLLLSSFLLVLCSMSKYSWFFGDVFAIIIAVSITRYLQMRFFVFIGTISANIYVLQQIVRPYYFGIPFDYESSPFLVSMLYLLVNITIAYIYTCFCGWIYRVVFDKLQLFKRKTI